jgi:hypothetical protein
MYHGIQDVCTTRKHAYLFTGEVALVFRGTRCISSIHVTHSTKHAVSEQGDILSFNPYVCLNGKRLGPSCEYAAFKPNGSQFVTASRAGYSIYNKDGTPVDFWLCDGITNVVWADKLYLQTGRDILTLPNKTLLKNRTILGVTDEGYIVTSIGEIIDPLTDDTLLAVRYRSAELFFRDNRFATNTRIYSFTEWVCLQLDIKLPQIDGPALIVADYLEEYGHKGHEQLREFMRVYDKYIPGTT